MKSGILAIAIAIALAAALSVPSAARAAPDDAQRQAIQMAAAARAKLLHAEAANGPERTGLMAEHMAMMKQVMDKMHGMKPRAGMSGQEREAWLEEHQGLMRQMMDQMVSEHRMMMRHADGKAPAAPEQRGGDAHKH